jgi:hypothetical protein
MKITVGTENGGSTSPRAMVKFGGEAALNLTTRSESTFHLGGVRRRTYNVGMKS